MVINVFIMGSFSSTFDDIVTFKTKAQLNSVAVNPGCGIYNNSGACSPINPTTTSAGGANLISYSDCANNSIFLKSILYNISTTTASTTGNIRANLTETQNCTSTLPCSVTNTYNYGDEAVA